jgi:ATPase family associated with various cellular activities (AAA)
MNATSNQQEFITFSPSLQAQDVLANYWLRQVTVRLRREICWRWHLQENITFASSASLPPLTNKLTEVLDMSRYWEAKCQFYEIDPTAKYLTEKLTADRPKNYPAVRGSFSWVVDTLALDEVSIFLLALGAIVCFDNAASEVISAVLNDSHATQPTLALAQKLWEQPEEILTIADPEHPLWCYGLLQTVHDANSAMGMDWQSPLVVPPLIANRLLFPNSSLPQVLVPLKQRSCTIFKNGHLARSTTDDEVDCGVGILPAPESPIDRAHLAALRSIAGRVRGDKLRIIPIQASRGAIVTEVVQEISQIAGRNVVELKENSRLFENATYLKSLVTLCWLTGQDLFIPSDRAEAKEGETSRCLQSLQSMPIAIFLVIRDRKELTHIPSDLLLPIVAVPQLSYGDRVNFWQQTLGTTDPIIADSIAECSRRFRYEKGTIQNICTGLKTLDRDINKTDLIAACRAELDIDIGELAQIVNPRFTAAELVLPPKQQALFDDIYQAMKSLTAVHYEWGTGKAWNECGISVLFSGLPGTGKTMAAEILAAKLELPMYRIDLSQVVNKYIGETEKNLKRLFDAADISDSLLFFDEADALFGRRTEVKDAHDRYANLEISYLLERMERFKGLAILATNRKKDLDEAFLRRLRYIIDFPLPDVRERQKIWQQAIPKQVDASEIDFDFVAKQFPLAGGNIRSIVFNACLQTAGSLKIARSPSLNPKLTMEQIVICVKREYDKLNRSVSREQFGIYANLVERMNHG